VREYSKARRPEKHNQIYQEGKLPLKSRERAWGGGRGKELRHLTGHKDVSACDIQNGNFHASGGRRENGKRKLLDALGRHTPPGVFQGNG